MVRILHALSAGLDQGAINQIGQLVARLEPHFLNYVCSLETDDFRHRDGAVSRTATDSCPQRRGFDPTFLRRFSSCVRRRNPDIVHWWGSPFNLPVLAATFLGGNPPVVNSLLQAYRFRRAQQPSYLRRWLLPKRRYLVSDQYSASVLQASCSVPLNVTILSPGLASHPGSRTLRSLHSELDVPPSARFVVALGGLRGEMRFKDLIWSLDLLRVIHTDVHLIIIGEGPDLAELQQYASAVGISDFVHFVGRCNQRNVLLSQCLCLWNAKPDGADASVLEAMLEGLPVISAAGDDRHHRLVRNGETGFTVPVGDCAEFARKTSLIISDSALAAQLGTAGRILAREEFSMDAYTAGVTRVYQEVLSERRSAA